MANVEENKNKENKKTPNFIWHRHIKYVNTNVMEMDYLPWDPRCNKWNEEKRKKIRTVKIQ